MGNDHFDMCDNHHNNVHKSDSFYQNEHSTNDLDIGGGDGGAFVVVTVKIPIQNMDNEEKSTKEIMIPQGDNILALNPKDSGGSRTMVDHGGPYKTPEVVISDSYGEYNMSDNPGRTDFDNTNISNSNTWEDISKYGSVQNESSVGNASCDNINGEMSEKHSVTSPRDPSHSKSTSPRRSQSPYSLGNMSGFREPGNISSHNFQENWDISNRSNLEKRNSPRNTLHEYDASPGKLSIEHYNNTDGTKMPLKNTHINSLAPYIPVVECSVELQASTISMNNGSKNNMSCEDKKADNGEDSKAAPPFRNDCLIRVSHRLRDGSYEKRVCDIRSVSELMEVYSTLKDPIILPFARQRTFYDQWARLPRPEATGNRLYPRSSSNLSIKCWTLFQAIQNDQIKSNSAPAGGSNKLLPNPADVTCKSLASIIEHYNQLTAFDNPVFNTPTKTPPATPLKHVKAKIASSQSSSSRSSSGNNNERGPVKAPHEQGGGEAQQSQSKEKNQLTGLGGETGGEAKTGEKHSPVPLRKKQNSNNVKCNNSQKNDLKHTRENENIHEYNNWNDQFDKCQNQNLDEQSATFVHDQEGKPFSGHQHQNHLEISTQQTDCLSQTSFTEPSIPTAKIFPSEEDIKEFNLLQQQQQQHNHQQRQEGNASHGRRQRHSRDQGNLSHLDDLTSTHNEKRKAGQNVTITVRDVDDNSLQHQMPPSLKGALEKRSETMAARDYLRNPLDVNTNTLSLNFPHEHVYNMNDFNEATNPMSPVEKRFLSYPNPGPGNIVGHARKSKTRLYFSQMSPKTERREMTFVSSSLHNPHQLKQSMHVHELHCPKDIESKYIREKTSKKTTRSKSSTWKSNNKPPELPTRGYSMCERLEPSENPFGRLSLSPEMCRPRSAKQPAVSLANVHFLDLSDLKTMLRKNNTPMPRL